MTCSSSDLPSGWSPARLEDIVSREGVFSDGDWVESKDQDPAGNVRLVQLADVGEMQFLDKSRRYMTGTQAAALNCTFLQKGDLLISRLGDPLGKTCAYPAKEEKAVTVVDVCILRPAYDGIEPKLFGYFLNSGSLRHKINSQSSGTTRKRVTGKKLKALEVPVPPANEQRRIVEKIETLFAQLDKGEEAIRQVQKLLKTYRQSVLKAAVTGELVKRNHSDWKSVALGSLLADIRYGTAKKCSYEAANTPVLRIPNVVGGNIRTDDLKYTDLSENEVKKLALRKGDVLIVRSNGSANLVARGAVVGEEEEGMSFAGYLIRLRVDQERILPEYLLLSLNSPQTRAQIDRQAKSTSGVHNINSGEVKAISIELPPLHEQSEIVIEVEESLQKTIGLEVWCETELKRSASLRQSVLKQAFFGKLVPQDPDDEPASVLLERIKAEKEASAPAVKTARKKSAKRKMKA